jgi:hypothetical protein
MGRRTKPPKGSGEYRFDDALAVLRRTPVALDGLPHLEFGVVTLEQHLATWVTHDLGHAEQVVRGMARQYTGRWSVAHVPPILKPR